MKILRVEYLIKKGKFSKSTIYKIEYDSTSDSVPKISKGTDGRGLRYIKLNCTS